MLIFLSTKNKIKLKKTLQKCYNSYTKDKFKTEQQYQPKTEKGYFYYFCYFYCMVSAKYVGNIMQQKMLKPI